eukprot:15171545-Ditylum_brightwellii.AAC.1
MLELEVIWKVWTPPEVTGGVVADITGAPPDVTGGVVTDITLIMLGLEGAASGTKVSMVVIVIGSTGVVSNNIELITSSSEGYH